MATLSILSDGDSLVERATGIRARYDRLPVGSDHIHQGTFPYRDYMPYGFQPPLRNYDYLFGLPGDPTTNFVEEVHSQHQVIDG